MISVSNNNNSPTFTSGITRKLCRNYYTSQQEIIDLFDKYPHKNGIAGQLPKSWIKNLNASKSISDRRVIINDIYKQFAAIIKISSKNVKMASKRLTKLLHKYKILPKTQSYTIEKINPDGISIKNGYILHGNRGAESLFVKEFKTSEDYSFAEMEMWTKRDGKYIELARALQLKHQAKDKHIMHTHWGDTKNGYIVSEYIKPFKKFNSFVKIKDCYNTENELISDLEKKYSFKYSELKKYNVQIGYKNDNKFYSYPEEIMIYNYFNNLLSKLNLVHHDLRNNPDNYIVTLNKNGSPLIKLIDFGGISK